MPRVKFTIPGRVHKPEEGELCQHNNPDHVVWATAEGRYFFLCEMTDKHVLRCYRLVERAYRNAFEEHFSWYPSFNGEMAQYYGEQAWEQEDRELGAMAIMSDLLRKQLYDRGVFDASS